jgi:hypothetical protein
LDLTRTPYEFHQQIESPSDFARREWKTLLPSAGVLTLALVVAILLVDAAFFYPRISSDPLNYFLKAQSLVERGTLDVAWAVNLPPFSYVAMPGLLRAPAVMGFQEFDHQLRAMQLMNVPILITVAGLSAYVLSWVLPRERHSPGIIFALGFTLLSPIWLANVFLPLADAPYAAFTLVTILLAIELLCSDKPVTHRPLVLLVFALTFAMSFFLRFTAPVLLLFITPLAIRRLRGPTQSKARVRLFFGMMFAAVAVLVALNADTIFGRYFNEPIYYLNRAEKTGILLNLFGASLPTQILPTFQLGFVHPPIVDLVKTSFSSTVPDMAWAFVGCAISAIVVAGMWLTRRPLLPELLYVIGALPVLALMMPSTTRYLMPYQAFYWIFFYVGATTLVTRHAPWLARIWRSRRVVWSSIAALAMLVVGLRVWKTAGTASERYHVVTLKSVPAYHNEVSSTFRSLRNYLETLPRDRTLLMGGAGAAGRWKVISGLDYYAPDSALTRVTAEKDVYLVVECGTLDACQAWDIYGTRVQARILENALVRFDSVFAVGSPRARAKVLRVRAVN